MISLAMVLKNSDICYLLIKDNINIWLESFAILHEIGHLETKTLNCKLLSKRDNEIKANLWAINTLQSIINDAYYSMLLSYVNNNFENELYDSISMDLSMNMVNYWNPDRKGYIKWNTKVTN